MTLTAQNYKATLKGLGFEVISTGGGFEALRRSFPGGRYILVTNYQDGVTFTADGDHCIVSAYDNDHQPVGDAWEGPLNEAFAAITRRSTETTLAGLKEFDANKVIDESLNLAVRHMQDALGVRAGDIAGVFFTGAHEKTIREVFQQYLLLEIAFMEPETTAASAERPRD